MSIANIRDLTIPSVTEIDDLSCEIFRIGDKAMDVQEDESLKVGDSVNFHSLVNGPITSSGHIIKAIELKPNNFGADVAWITDKSGCVALAALSKEYK